MQILVSFSLCKLCFSVGFFRAIFHFAGAHMQYAISYHTFCGVITAGCCNAIREHEPSNNNHAHEKMKIEKRHDGIYGDCDVVAFNLRRFADFCWDLGMQQSDYAPLPVRHLNCHA